MAKKSINKKDNLPMEEVLWKACDALRGSIEPSEYKHVVLSKKEKVRGNFIRPKR